MELADPRGDTPDLVRELVERGARVLAVTEDVASLEQVYLDLVGERADRDPEATRAAYLVFTVFGKEWREIASNKLLLGAVAAPAVIFAAIPTVIVAFIQVNDLDMSQLGQIEAMLAAFPDLPPKLAAQGFIVTNFMAYFLLIPAMVPIAIASQSVIGERQARSLEPQLATPIEVSELLAGKTHRRRPAGHPGHLGGLDRATG